MIRVAGWLIGLVAVALLAPLGLFGFLDGEGG